MTAPISSSISDVPARPIVLITGSEGLIGSRVVNALSTRYRIIGLDVKKSPLRNEDAKFINCDLTKTESVVNALSNIRERYGRALASVIHLAAYYDFSGEPSPLYEQLTVEGTRRLLGELQSFEVEQFVFSSSLLVMKPADEGEVITEDGPTESEWDYPRSKLEAEAVIRREHGGIPVVVLRIAGVYDEDGHSIPIGQQIARIYEKKLESYLFPGDANRGQAYVHLDDLVDCFVNCVDRRAQLSEYEVLLIAEPDVMSYGELQDKIGELLHGREWPTLRIPKALAKAGAWVQDRFASEDEPTFIKPWMIDLADAHYPVAIDRARLKLEWTPHHRLRGTLDEMIHRLKRDPVGWYERNGLPVPEDA